MTPYDTIYSRFAQKITDFKILELSDSDVEELLYGYLISSVAKFKKCQTDLSLREEELKVFTEDLLDLEVEILAMMMVSEWLAPQLNSVMYTSQFFGGKEEKFFSQANQLHELMALEEKNTRRARKLIRDYTYRNNEYLKG